MKKWNSLRFSQLESSMRIITCVRIFSQMRGGAKKYVGPSSFRSIITVAPDSGQLRQKPAI